MGDWDAQYQAYKVSYLEVALAATPNRQLAVFSPHCGCGVRLYISLMHGGGAVFPLHNDVSLFEPSFNISQFEHELVGDVGGLFCVVFVSKSAGSDVGIRRVGKPLVQNRSVGFHGFQHVGYCGQNLIIHLNQSSGFVCHLAVNGRDRSYGMPFIQGLLRSHDVIADPLGVGHGAFA